jgi:hypothetical protein
VRITGGKHRADNYTRVITRETRCYVDVFVPQVRQQVRVRKTSVQVEGPMDPPESRVTRPFIPGGETQENKGAAAVQLLGDLMALCEHLAQLGVAEGDAHVHALVDAGLMIAREQWPARKSRTKKEKGHKNSGEVP